MAEKYSPHARQQCSNPVSLHTKKVETEKIDAGQILLKSVYFFTMLLLGHSRLTHLFGMFFQYQWRYLLVLYDACSTLLQEEVTQW